MNDKPYRPPSAQNEQVNVVFTSNGLTYNSPVNQNSKTIVIHDDSEDEVDEAKKEVEPSFSKQTKSDPPPLKAYKPKVPCPQRLRKEKMEECYPKFIDLIKEVRINVPLVDVLAGMPNYEKFLKDLVSNKSKMKQIFATFFNEECSATVQNKLPPQLVTKEKLDALLKESKPFFTTLEKISESSLDQEFGQFIAIKIKEITEFGIILKVNFLFAKDRLMPGISEVFQAKASYSFLRMETRRFFSSSLSGADMTFRRRDSFSRKVYSKCLGKGFITRSVGGSWIEFLILQFSTRVDQEKTTFTCSYRTYSYKRMPFGLCNVPASFQRRMISIFQYMLETSMEVFMDDFLVFGDSFDPSLVNLEKMLVRCKQAHLVLSWEKCHFMMIEGILLEHKVYSAGLEVD
nr:reverse transcriptase domain-containing protein [Tanacetum cinerariifolium]